MICRSAGPGRKTPTPRPPRARSTNAPVAVRKQADERDGGRCVRCGATGTNQQHREGRGAGGRGKADAARTNGLAWRLTVCGQGNTSGCHAEIDQDRVRSEREGYVIRRNGPRVDAAEVPVLTVDGWQLFLDDGTRVPCPTPEPDWQNEADSIRADALAGRDV